MPGFIPVLYGADAHILCLFTILGDQYRRHRQQVGMLFPMPRGK
jgi:hypothetical protein